MSNKSQKKLLDPEAKETLQVNGIKEESTRAKSTDDSLRQRLNNINLFKNFTRVNYFFFQFCSVRASPKFIKIVWRRQNMRIVFAARLLRISVKFLSRLDSTSKQEIVSSLTYWIALKFRAILLQRILTSKVTSLLTSERIG